MALSPEQKSSRLFKKSVGVGEALTSWDFFEEKYLGKTAILPSQIWTQANEIPTSAPILDDGVTQGVVQYHEQLTLTHVPGAVGKSYYSLDLVDCIPFNYGDGKSYNYLLYTSGGVEIPFGLGDWLVDTDAGLLTFYANDLPSGVDANNPPKISFYKYVGLKGLSDISSDIEGLSIELSTEIVTRSTADASLTNLVSTETYIRFSGDTVLTNRISTEEVKRSTGLSTELSQRVSTDTVLTNRISTEEVTRSTADASLSTSLSQAISTETAHTAYMEKNRFDSYNVVVAVTDQTTFTNVITVNYDAVLGRQIVDMQSVQVHVNGLLYTFSVAGSGGGAFYATASGTITWESVLSEPQSFDLYFNPIVAGFQLELDDVITVTYNKYATVGGLS